MHLLFFYWKVVGHAPTGKVANEPKSLIIFAHGKGFVSIIYIVVMMVISAQIKEE